MGYKRKDGYIDIYYKEHPNARRNGYIMEHRLVMSQQLKRPLKSYEVVHHRNGIRDDNRPANLELWIHGHPSGQKRTDLILDIAGLIMNVVMVVLVLIYIFI